LNQIKENNRFYPRQLTKREKYFLFSILPEEKTGYKAYREKIENFYVIGQGRYGETNYILGHKDSKPDLSLPLSPIFACGSIIYKEGTVDIIIHEESENRIEFDISFSNPGYIPDDIQEINRCIYSLWLPGENAPQDNSEVREIVIKEKEYILAISPLHKKLWLYDFKTGINHLLPVSNFYNYLMIVKNIRNPQLVSRPQSLFEKLDYYSDNELVSAFILYNKYFKKADIKSFEKPRAELSKKHFLNFFKRNRN
jgi:hypothetical protein